MEEEDVGIGVRIDSVQKRENNVMSPIRALTSISLS